jgi:hypothetical protein
VDVDGQIGMGQLKSDLQISALLFIVGGVLVASSSKWVGDVEENFWLGAAMIVAFGVSGGNLF